jgi:lipoprotein-anchoring transpeptidase ErfK/SrfK
MNKFRFSFIFALLTITSFMLTACVQPPQNNAPVNQTPVNQAPSPTPANTNQQLSVNIPLTLPVLDAMFADEAFSAELRSKLGLTDEQIEKLKNKAREAVINLSETENGSTAEAVKSAEREIGVIIGEAKTKELADFINQRPMDGELADLAEGRPNQVPTDTRIVVNIPAYRMDVYKNGKLVRTYKIGIGYPEFPLPTGMRKAKGIIFNPTWTPPDEPWVKGKVKPFEKIEAGSRLNPLGPIKIPIGLPSLIHGGKNPWRLGTFASHGCVGLTNPQVQDFALALAQISETPLTSADVANYEKNKTETKNVKLSQPISIELRYETIVVEDGKLHIYRDVYERGTNTEENLRKVLESYNAPFDSLNETEKSRIQTALSQMALNAQGNAKRSKKNKNASGSVTRSIKGAKEVVIEIAALKGKGYPAPVDLNTGGRSRKPFEL